jgi:hypothetical protein
VSTVFESRTSVHNPLHTFSYLSIHASQLKFILGLILGYIDKKLQTIRTANVYNEESVSLLICKLFSRRIAKGSFYIDTFFAIYFVSVYTCLIIRTIILSLSLPFYIDKKSQPGHPICPPGNSPSFLVP